MSAVGTVKLGSPAATDRESAQQVRGSLGIRQMSSGNEAGVASPRDYRPGVAVRLVSAFTLFAILPIVAAIVGLLGVAAVNTSLDELQSTSLYFGTRDREFRRGVQVLARVYADASNFDSPQALEQSRSDITDGLETMRVNLEKLAALGMIDNAGELIIEQRSVEIATAAALQIAEQRLDLLAAAGRDPARSGIESTAVTRTEQELYRRHRMLRDRHETMIGLLADIDQTHLKETQDRVDGAQQALQRMALGIIGICALCSLIAILIICFYVVRRVTRRLERISIGIDRLNAGNLSGPISCSGDDELAKMTGALEALRSKSIVLREVELALKSCRKNLDKSNSDRDRFAHAAAHDLRAPVRGIRNIVEFIEEDLGDEAHDKTRRHLDIMRGRIARLDDLLESLLEYTRAGSVHPPIQVHSAREIIEYSIEHVPDELARVEVTCEDGEVGTWREPLQQILIQLIDNAIKHNDHHPALLRIDCRLQRKSLRIRVIDDGPGIEPRYHKRIFDMFQTLQSRDSVEGSGMGLAIAHKLAMSYGGRILVESEPAKERGATFMVTWPIDAGSGQAGTPD